MQTLISDLNLNVRKGCEVACKSMNIQIIAEAGANYNGDLGLALKLVEEAKKAGADYIKFKRIRASKVTT